MKQAQTNQLFSIVIPVKNEIDNVKTLNKRLISLFKEAKMAYELIYIDDHSTDGTYEYLRKIKNSKKQKIIQAVRVLRKQGKPGKAYSLVEGFAAAKGDILGMIDADLQYPPEAILEMITMLQDHDIVVANRKTFHASVARRITSRVFRKAFGDLLFGLKVDVQSGMKVFKRTVYSALPLLPKSPWTFDLDFLYKAHEFGYKIGSHDIAFAKREKGTSHVRFVQQSAEIGFNALQVRFKRRFPLIIPPDSDSSMVGAGIGFKKHQYITHTTLPHHQTALQTFAREQVLLITSLLILAFVSLFFYPLATIRLLVGIISIVYFIDVVFNLFIVLRSLYSDQALIASDASLTSLIESELPVYSILCPLYKEAAILPMFLDAIDKLDWPKDKLDVLLLLEEDDVQSIEVTKTMQMPNYVRTIIVPHSQPKTKPKACNYGLNHVKGEYVVIYDAEDVPDPRQLKKAYVGFLESDENVVCLQAKLNYYNPSQNLLTRFFTAEYSLWFDLTLTGFQSINTSIPLGGTSNHFKTAQLQALHGWDTFNVTEDADLGIRLFKHGYKTAIIDSVTLEEANSNVKNWIRQRSRWLKGYMQSYLVHMRDFPSFFRTKGVHAILFQLVVGAKMTFIFLNPILWLTTIAYYLFRSTLGPTIELMYLTPVFYLASISLVFGNFLFLYYYLAGCANRKQWDLIKYVLLIPLYWILISIAGWMAFYQLLLKPHYWEKTIHGLHLKKKKDDDDEPRSDSQNYAPAEEKVKRFFFPQPVFAGAWVRSTFINVADVKQIVRNNYYALSNLILRKKSKTSVHKKPAILIFNWRDTSHVWAGGAEVYVQEIAKRWVAEGNEVMIFCGNDGRSPQNQTVNGVRVTRRGGTYTIYIWAVLYYLFVFRGKYDVIVDCENGIPFFTPLFARKPIFLLIHHVHQEVFRQHLKFPLSSIAMFLESRCMPFVYRNKPVITVSESSKQEILKLGFAYAENIFIIQNGIDSKLFGPLPKGKIPRFSYLGRLKPYKNIDTAIKAFDLVLRKYPEAQLDIVGEGESMKYLRDLVVQLGIQTNVTFHGKVSEEMKASFLAKSWAMLQPSMMEGWGITVIEANACGTPVIASHVNGLKDSVLDRKTGILVNPKKVEEFAEAMIALIENPKYLQQMNGHALSWSRNFTWDKSAEMFYSLITTVLPETAYIPSYGGLAVVESK